MKRTLLSVSGAPVIEVDVIDRREISRSRIASDLTLEQSGLVVLLDVHFKSVETEGCSRQGRAIVGISQGGFGSMSYAARHPRLFGAAASFSGAVDIWSGATCRVGAIALIGGIMTGLNQVQPFAAFGDPVTHAANWRSRDPGSLVRRLRHTRVDLYTSTGFPGRSDLQDPAVPGTADRMRSGEMP